MLMRRLTAPTDTQDMPSSRDLSNPYPKVQNKSMSCEREPTYSSMCGDLVQRVFNHLHWRDLFRMEAVCRQWRRVARTKSWARFTHYDTSRRPLKGDKRNAKKVNRTLIHLTTKC